MKRYLVFIGLVFCSSSWAERDSTGAPITPDTRSPIPVLEAERTPSPTTSAPATPSASSSSSAPPDTPRPSTVAPQRQQISREPVSPTLTPQFEPNFRFSLLSESCIDNTPFSLLAKEFLPPVSTRWFVKTPSRMVLLNSLPAEAISTIKLTLFQPDVLQPGLSYPLYFQLDNETQYRHSQLSISACETNITEESPHSGELLVLIDRRDLDTFLRYTEQRHIPIKNQTALYGDTLLITLEPKPKDLSVLQNQLQQAFPNLEIDTNDYLTQAGAPRTYAKAQLNWPENTCQHVTMPIGIIDGPIDNDHASLKSQSIISKDFIDAPINDPDHATAISVILSGNGSDTSLAGLLSHAELYAANVMEETFFGTTASVSAIVQALAWFADLDVRLVNMSLSGKKANRVLAKVTTDLSKTGMLIFAAVGNNGEQDRPYYPAAFQHVIAVTAIDAANKLYRSANQGDYIDFAAPGVDIWTADDEHAGQYRTGTSYATPYVVAAAANLLSLNPQMPSALIYQSLKASVIDLGAKGRDVQFGWGAVQYTDTCTQ